MIDRCICRHTSFAKIKESCAAQSIQSIDVLVDKLEVGDMCQMCLPYLETMLETGETEFS